MALGAYRQMIMVFPELDIVAVTTGRADDFASGEFADLVFSSVKSNESLPADASGANLLAMKIRDASTEKRSEVGVAGVNGSKASLRHRDVRPRYDQFLVGIQWSHRIGWIVSQNRCCSSGWQTSTPEEQCMDATQLAGLVDFGTTHSFDSLLIARHGKIVTEAYYAPYTAGIPHAVNSVTKAVISTLTAIAWKEGALDTPERRVLDFFDWRRSVISTCAKASGKASN